MSFLVHSQQWAVPRYRQNFSSSSHWFLLPSALGGGGLHDVYRATSLPALTQFYWHVSCRNPFSKAASSCFWTVAEYWHQTGL